MRTLTILSGFLLVATGIFALANQGVSFLSMAFIIGLVMIVSGIILCSGYVYGRYAGTGGDADEKVDQRAGRFSKDSHGWIMIDGSITFILGVLVLSNQLKAEIAVVSVFGLWMLDAGIRRMVIASYINRNRKVQNFYWTMGTGIVNAAAGLYAFLDEDLLNLTISSLLGVFFVLQGISTLELGIHMPHHNVRKGILKKIEAQLGEMKPQEEEEESVVTPEKE